MNIGDVYENRKNPARHVRIVSCVDGKLKADVLGDGGNAIDEMETSEAGFTRSWKLFEAAPVPELDPQPAVVLDDTEVPREVTDAEHQAQLAGIPAEPTRISLSYPEPEDRPRVPIRYLVIQKTLYLSCPGCADMHALGEEGDFEDLDEIRGDFEERHLEHLWKKEAQGKLNFGHEASGANGEAVA